MTAVGQQQIHTNPRMRVRNGSTPRLTCKLLRGLPKAEQNYGCWKVEARSHCHPVGQALLLKHQRKHND
jgi:hypothetical protein